MARGSIRKRGDRTKGNRPQKYLVAMLAKIGM